MLCCIRYIRQSSPSATAPLLPYTFALPMDLSSAPKLRVLPSCGETNPVVPFSAFKPMSAKYVKLLSHSTLTPSFIRRPIAPAVRNVTLWNSILACTLLESSALPSTRAPRPASPSSKPLGSLALVTLPFVITLTFCT